MVVVSGEVLFADEEIVIRVELPELAVDDVEVFVREEVHHLVDVVLLVQQRQHLKSGTRRVGVPHLHLGRQEPV